MGLYRAGLPGSRRDRTFPRRGHVAQEVPVPNLGIGELILIFLIVLMFFGAARLPQIGEGIGKGIRNLKRGLTENDDIDVTSQGERDPERLERGSAPKASDNVTDAEVVER
jgi:sec-independent protein translocase protein TatA